MKLTKQMLREMIEETMMESIDFGGADWTRGYTAGTKRAMILLKKGETQSAKGLKRYIQKATEKHPNPSWRNGYEFAFKLRFSAQLGTPPSKGQLPYANARRAPRPGFFGFKYENKLKEAITGASLQDLAAEGSLYDIMKKSGMDRLLNAAYVSGQRNEPIEELDDGDPWFQGKFPLLQKQWKKGRQWAGEQYPDFAG